MDGRSRCAAGRRLDISRNAVYATDSVDQQLLVVPAREGRRAAGLRPRPRAWSSPATSRTRPASMQMASPPAAAGS